MEPIYCSVVDAARALGVGRSTIYVWMTEKRLRSVRVGGRRLIPVAAVREFAEQIEAEAA